MNFPKENRFIFMDNIRPFTFYQIRPQPFTKYTRDSVFVCRMNEYCGNADDNLIKHRAICRNVFFIIFIRTYLFYFFCCLSFFSGLPLMLHTRSMKRIWYLNTQVHFFLPNTNPPLINPIYGPGLCKLTEAGNTVIKIPMCR